MTCSIDFHVQCALFFLKTKFQPFGTQGFDKSGGHFRTHVALKKYPLSVIGSRLEVLLKLEGSPLLWGSYRQYFADLL